MAERLAPLTVVAPITSRPEPVRGRVWRRLRLSAVAVTLLALTLAGTVYTAHFLSIERHAREMRATSLVPPGLPARVLVIVARPGQELPMAGTLATLHEAGTSVAMLSLTSDLAPADGPSRIPAQPASGPPADLAVPEALAAEAITLGVDTVAVAGFEPGQLMMVDPAAVTERIREAIRGQRPSAIITVGDAQGGDLDSQAVAGYTLLAAGEPGAGVARVWTVARGAWERDWQALAGSATVSQRPSTPQAAVRLLGDIVGVKSRAMAAYRDHGTAGVVDAHYPAWDWLPSTLYLRFWDREYFALAWGSPLH